jgi:hypothetical protein
VGLSWVVLYCLNADIKLHLTPPSLNCILMHTYAY